MAKKKNKDVFADHFEKTLAKINLINQPKSILDEQGKIKTEFEANGTTYYIFPPKKVFNIGRQVAYWNLETSFGLNQSPLGIYERFQQYYHDQIRLMQATGDDWIKLQDANLRNSINNMDSFKEHITNRYAPAYYMCTLFIVTDNEDLAEWDFEIADKKIDDWAAEGLSPFDFFSIALSFSKRSQEIIELIYQA